jgi:RNA polymerase sigma factor (sigma-70 family)
MTPDLELLDAWRRGDRQAGDELFVRHFDSVYRFFGGKVGADAEDLVQATFLACVEGQERFRQEAGFRTYLLAIARNLLYRHWRSRSRSGPPDFSVTSLQDLGPSPSTLMHARSEQRLVLEGLRRIPIDLQLALELHYWERMSGPEIALVLDLPEGTVRSRLRRAREALLEKLGELAQTPGELASTTSNLDDWATSLAELDVVGGHRVVKTESR